MTLYSMIPSDRYITREELVKLSGLSDRVVREKISELRKSPSTIIISSSSHKGYKKPATVEELESTRNEFRSREKELHEAVEVFDRAIRKMKRELRQKNDTKVFRETQGYLDFD